MPCVFIVQVSSPGVGPGVGVGVELVSRGQQDPFRGFLLQARDVTTDQAVGFFTLAPNTLAKYLSCSNNRQVYTPPAEIFKLPGTYAEYFGYCPLFKNCAYLL